MRNDKTMVKRMTDGIMCGKMTEEITGTGMTEVLFMASRKHDTGH